MSKLSVQAESSQGIFLKEAYFCSFFFLHVYIYKMFSFLLKSRKHICPDNRILQYIKKKKVDKIITR